MKLLKILLGIIGAIITFVLAAGVILALLILDFNVVEPEYLNDTNSLNLSAEKSLSQALSYAETKSVLNFSLTEEELNIILKVSTNEINKSLEPLGFSIRALYVDIISENAIKYTCYISFYGITSSIKGEFKYSNGIDAMHFEFSDFYIGLINIKTSLFKEQSVSGKPVNDYLMEELKDKEFKALFLNNGALSISISYDYLQKLMFNVVEIAEDSFLTPVLNVLLNSGKTINLDEEKFNFVIDLKPFELNHENDYYQTKNYTCQLAISDVEKLLNDNVITPDEADLVATYIMVGYDRLNETDKEIIKTIDLSSVNITDNENYKGLVDYYEGSVGEFLLNERISDTEFVISELDISRFLLQKGIVGQMNCFTYKNIDKYYSSFIGVEDMYVDITDTHMYFYFNVSLDGLVMPIVLSSKINETKGLRSVLNISELRIGSVEITDSSQIVDFLAKNINLEWFYFNAIENQIIIDFTNIFKDVPELSPLLVNIVMSYSDDISSGAILFTVV